MPAPAPVHVACPAPDGFQPDVDAVRAAIGPRTRMLVLSSPSNPTGAVIARERLVALAELAREHDLVVLADEIYERFVYDGEGHVSVATLEGMRERTLLANSLSKSYAMTGWRVGWLAGRRRCWRRRPPCTSTSRCAPRASRRWAPSRRSTTASRS